MFRYIDDVLSLYNSKFGDFVDLIYPIELEKRIPQIQIGLLHLKIDSEGQSGTKLYNKRDDFHIPIVNFPFI